MDAGRHGQEVERQVPRLLADLGLALTTVLWGTTFIMMKMATNHFWALAFLSWRYLLASVVTLPFLLRVKKELLWKGLSLGAVLWLGMAFQILGIQSVSAGTAGFITGLSVVLVPIIGAISARIWPPVRVMASVLLAAVGLFFLSGGRLTGFSFGFFLEILGAGCFAYQIHRTGELAGSHPLELVSLEMAAGALLGLPFLFFGQTLPTTTTLGVIAYMAIFGSVGAIWAQSYLQRFTSPTRTALIFTLEPVFAALFAYLWGGETMGASSLIGAALVFSGLVVSEARRMPSRAERKAPQGATPRIGP